MNQRWEYEKEGAYFIIVIGVFQHLLSTVHCEIIEFQSFGETILYRPDKAKALNTLGGLAESCQDTTLLKTRRPKNLSKGYFPNVTIL